MSGTKMITPTTIALDKAAELVQVQINDLEDGIVEMNCDDTIHLLKELKKDILARKPARESVRSTFYKIDMDDLTPEEEEERKQRSLKWLETLGGPDWEASK